LPLHVSVTAVPISAYYNKTPIYKYHHSIFFNNALSFNHSPKFRNRATRDSSCYLSTLYLLHFLTAHIRRTSGRSLCTFQHVYYPFSQTKRVSLLPRFSLSSSTLLRCSTAHSSDIKGYYYTVIQT